MHSAIGIVAIRQPFDAPDPIVFTHSGINSEANQDSVPLLRPEHLLSKITALRPRDGLRLLAMT
jgi:hypothetical protein